MGGEVVDISPVSETHFNPLDFKYNKDTGILPQNEKSEFVLSLFEKIMEPQNVMPGDKSLVDACLKNIYQPLINSNYTIACPTLVDLWEELQKQLKPVAMLSMLEFINTTVMNNDRTDAEAGTWVYFDEICLLLRDEQSAVFLNESWKRYRKYNAFATGITQNVTDCTANPTARAILSNSEFLVLMRQTRDIDSITEIYNLSASQAEYLKLATAGHGLLKMGNNMIPFENTQPQTGKVYKLISTKPGERKKQE